MTSGIDAEPTARSATCPAGAGSSGVLISEPRPLRLTDVGAHPRVVRVPARPPADGGVPRRPDVIRGQAWGNLYLTEKAGGDVRRAGRGGRHRARRLGGDGDRQRARLPGRTAPPQRAGAGRPRARDDDGDRPGDRRRDAAGPVLELLVKRSRALVAAGSMVLLLRDGEELVVTAVAGAVDATWSACACRSRRFRRRRGAARRPGRADRRTVGSRVRSGLGERVEATTGLLVPLLFNGQAPRGVRRVRPAHRRPGVLGRGRAPDGRLRRERGDCRRQRAERRPARPAAQHRGRARPSAAGGRASCTTTRCRNWPR